MTISTTNMKKLATIGAGKTPLTKRELELCITIWKESYQSFFKNRLSIFFKPARWFKTEGMPDFIIDLVKLVQNWNNIQDANKVIRNLIIHPGTGDNLALTHDPKANSTKIMLTLSSRIDLTSNGRLKFPTETESCDITEAMQRAKGPKRTRSDYYTKLGIDYLSRTSASYATSSSSTSKLQFDHLSPTSAGKRANT